MKRLCVIPARRGSRRIPRKNFLPFLGRPIIEYSLEAAVTSGLYETIVLSTDADDYVPPEAYREAVAVQPRPPELSTDDVPVLDVVRFAAHVASTDPWDSVTLLYATCPLIDASDLVTAMRNFEERRTGYPLLAVGTFDGATGASGMCLSTDGTLSPTRGSRCQDGDSPAYKDAGAFCIYPGDFLEANLDGVAVQFDPFVVTADKAIDINHDRDWRRAEIAFARQHGC